MTMVNMARKMMVIVMLIADGHKADEADDDDADKLNGKWWWSLRSPDNAD